MYDNMSSGSTGDSRSWRGAYIGGIREVDPVTKRRLFTRVGMNLAHRVKLQFSSVL